MVEGGHPAARLGGVVLRLGHLSAGVTSLFIIGRQGEETRIRKGAASLMGESVSAGKAPWRSSGALRTEAPGCPGPIGSGAVLVGPAQT